MKKEHSKLYNLSDLVPGDRFYFAKRSKTQRYTLVEINITNKHGGKNLKSASYKEDDKKHPMSTTRDMKVVFLRNAKDKK